MQPKDLREKTNEELMALLEEKKKELINFRLKLVTGVVDNVRAGRLARRDIARIKTILRERELAQEPKILKKTRKHK
ncbi:MAG TPA: 50S ribosomal protein L29 [Candidatus Hydrogenedens sp.]|nr:50S ribosomal protein L29 [Candidatus Hydrogenedens sp.]HOK10185.1 50S ribosomal protein L29 [Candidatus Hydrogenedens sp.]HOL20932.1 50S ribosomal protein L29 [Candidatus Hydrogenedens sp.]HPP59733.1 50S ribosomal protein L29 [Candidatus Hydrogenedens sp.]